MYCATADGPWVLGGFDGTVSRGAALDPVVLFPEVVRKSELEPSAATLDLSAGPFRKCGVESALIRAGLKVLPSCAEDRACLLRLGRRAGADRIMRFVTPVAVTYPAISGSKSGGGGRDAVIECRRLPLGRPRGGIL